MLTVARHPLDVLVSVLRFAAHEPDTVRWLGGRGGDEAAVLGVSPRSRAFAGYAAGPRATALLAVTPDWWGRPGVAGVRYEDLVADPVGPVAGLAAAFGPLRADPVAAAARVSFGRQQRGPHRHHYWQGRPGVWREVLPAAEARVIAGSAAVAGALAALGYGCDPDPALDAETADRNWRRLIAAGAAHRLTGSSVPGALAVT